MLTLIADVKYYLKPITLIKGVENLQKISRALIMDANLWNIYCEFINDIFLTDIFYIKINWVNQNTLGGFHNSINKQAI